jgi:hypothetical protein
MGERDRRHPLSLSYKGLHEGTIVAISTLQKYKIAFLLNQLPLGEIQSHTTVVRVVRIGRKPKKGIEWQQAGQQFVKSKVKIVKGTGIPASTLSRIKNDPKVKLSRVTVKKLCNMYERLQFQKLRAAGANQKDAKKRKSYNPDKVKVFVSTYIKNAKKIQAHYEQSYYNTLKAFKKQERDKLKPSVKKPPVKKPPAKPAPQKAPDYIPRPEDKFYYETEEIPTDIESQAQFKDSETYIDTDAYEDEDEDRQEAPETQEEIKEPPMNDYPSLEEVIFGMSESEHEYSDWDEIALYKGDK